MKNTDMIAKKNLFTVAVCLLSGVISAQEASFSDSLLISNTGNTDYSAYKFNFAPLTARIVGGGTVVTSFGEGISNAKVSLTDSQGNSIRITAGKTGGFRFVNIPAGGTFIISVFAKGYTFGTQVVNPTADVRNLFFTAL